MYLILFLQQEKSALNQDDSVLVDLSVSLVDHFHDLERHLVDVVRESSAAAPDVEQLA